LTEAGKILGIRVLDHVIVTRKGYFSFQEAGLIKKDRHTTQEVREGRISRIKAEQDRGPDTALVFAFPIRRK